MSEFDILMCSLIPIAYVMAYFLAEKVREKENNREEILKDIRDGYVDVWDNMAIDELFEEIEKEHKEVQAYRAIDTVDELKALKEKSVAKKPVEKTRNDITVFECPSCNAGLYSGQRYCDECGQEILEDYE